MNSDLSATTSRAAFSLRTLVVGIVTLAVVWIGLLMAGEALSARVGSAFGTQLQSLGKGRVGDPAAFVHARLRESALLLTVAIVLYFVVQVIWNWLVPRVSRTWVWVPLAFIVFAAVNVWQLFAAETGLYWLVLHAGHANLKQSAFHIERLLAHDGPADKQVAVIGSSQGHSEIHTGLLNELFGPKVRFANLSYSGSKAFDFVMIQDYFSARPPDYVVIYLSELNIYEAITGRRCLALLTPHSLKRLTEMGVWDLPIRDGLAYGIMGATIPLFRSRQAVEMFLFGRIAEFAPSALIPVRGQPKSDGKQEKAVAKDASDDEAKSDPSEAGSAGDALEGALAGAKVQWFYEVNDQSEFNKRSLETFIEQNLAAGSQVIVIAGQLNPAELNNIKDAVHQDYAEYLTYLREKFPDVKILDDELPRHPVADYVDPWHISPAARERYTKQLGQALSAIFGGK